LRVLFFGYSQLGFRTVELLLARGDEVAAVVTHRDDPAERRWYRTPAEAAAAHGLPIVYSEDLDLAQAPPAAGPGLARLAAETAPDLVLSVFYRELLPEAVLGAPRLAALNLHPSYLPAYRGRAPINWALVNGETSTGVTLHHMVRRADAGDIVAQRRVPIRPRETALSLYLAIEQAGVELLEEALPRVAGGTAPRLPQDESRASKFGRRRPEDGRIDWTWPAARIDRLVRAVAPPWPGAFCEIDGRRVVIAAGEPSEPLSADAAVAPGTVRREARRLLIAAADRWFRVDEADGLDLPAPSSPAASPTPPTAAPPGGDAAPTSHPATPGPTSNDAKDLSA
jgi:methionyl-tRNA formyltransferase